MYIYMPMAHKLRLVCQVDGKSRFTCNVPTVGQLELLADFDGPPI